AREALGAAFDDILGERFERVDRLAQDLDTWPPARAALTLRRLAPTERSCSGHRPVTSAIAR
ncbi:MAG TPA: hypothetical protein VLV28_02490, partial [Gaiellaceae bacterium]|nr:hypothetical protein [Gaiellaceae bacterium]